MAKERHFTKTIFPTKGGGVVVRTEGGEDVTLKNQTKEKRIPPDLLSNLKSLAIVAAVGESDGSEGQSFLDDELDKLKKKYPGEQPQEVWRRTLAVLVGQSIDKETIAGALLSLNNRFYTSMALGTSSVHQRVDKIAMIEDKISEFWPSSPNLA